jgi:hypothetical protein
MCQVLQTAGIATALIAYVIVVYLWIAHERRRY